MNLTPKPHCILHVGMHKTGSSSIQATLSKQMPGPEFEYVNLGPAGNSSQVIYSLFSEKPGQYHTNKKMGFTENDIFEFNQANLAKLAEIFKNTQSSLVIISAEDISVLHEAELEHLKAFLMQYCQSIQVIGYVRPFIAYMQSALQQVIKDGLAVFTLDDLYPCYQDKFEKFDKVFGKDQVLLIKYDVATLKERDVVLDFCQHCGISIDPESVIRQNEAISLEAVALLYTYHKIGFGFGYGVKAFRENGLLIKAISSIGNKKIGFSSAATDALLEKYSDDIQWIEDRIGCSLKEPLAASAEGISSVDDLFELSVESAENLKKLVFFQIQQQVATPQKIADWMQLLRVQLLSSDAGQNSLIYTSAQVDQLKNLNTGLNDLNGQLVGVLKDIFLSLGDADPEEAIIGSRRKIMPFFHAGTATADDKGNISYSIDLYRDGYIMGWIMDKSTPLKLAVELHCIHGKIGEGIADQFRADLIDAVSEDGCCAFRIKVDTNPNDFGDWIILRVKDYNKYFVIDASTVKQ